MVGAPNPITEEKLLWLIDYWKHAAERNEAMRLTVSGAGEGAEIYRNTEAALRELRSLRARFMRVTSKP